MGVKNYRANPHRCISEDKLKKISKSYLSLHQLCLHAQLPKQAWMAGLGDSLIIAPLNTYSNRIIEETTELFQFGGSINTCMDHA